MASIWSIRRGGICIPGGEGATQRSQYTLPLRLKDIQMTQGGRRGIVLAAFVVLTGTTVASAQSASPTVIDRANCDTVKDLLPASVLAWVKKGDLSMPLGTLHYEPSW